MSAEAPAYSPVYIKAWTVLSIVLGAVLLGMFLFGDTLLHVGGIVWSLLRWLASPII
jgi:hypothetical protein